MNKIIFTLIFLLFPTIASADSVYGFPESCSVASEHEPLEGHIIRVGKLSHSLYGLSLFFPDRYSNYLQRAGIADNVGLIGQNPRLGSARDIIAPTSSDSYVIAHIFVADEDMEPLVTCLSMPYEIDRYSHIDFGYGWSWLSQHKLRQRLLSKRYSRWHWKRWYKKSFDRIKRRFRKHDKRSWKRRWLDRRVRRRAGDVDDDRRDRRDLDRDGWRRKFRDSKSRLRRSFDGKKKRSLDRDGWRRKFRGSKSRLRRSFDDKKKRDLDRDGWRRKFRDSKSRLRRSFDAKKKRDLGRDGWRRKFRDSKSRLRRSFDAKKKRDLDRDGWRRKFRDKIRNRRISGADKSKKSFDVRSNKKNDSRDDKRKRRSNR